MREFNQEHFNNLEKAKINDDLSSVGRGIAEILSDFESVNYQKEIVRFPEPLFVKHFLPLFSGQVQPTPQLNLSVWITIAQGEYNPVHIVDQKNEILFTVPPMLERDAIDPIITNQQGVNSVMKNAARLREISLRDSDIFMNKSILGLHLREKATPKILENIQIWNNIFARYNLPIKMRAEDGTIVDVVPGSRPITSNTSNSSAGTAIAANLTSEDDIEYD